MKTVELDYSELEQFSARDRAYILQPEKFKAFSEHPFEMKAFDEVIKIKSAQQIDRSLIQQVLKDQYAPVSSSKKTNLYLDQIATDDAYTIITAHQPSLLSGPLYYIFKILSAINLAEKLQERYPDKQIIPMFVIGGEDHDYEEINHLHLFGQKIEWENDGAGSVGNFTTAGLSAVLTQVKEKLGENNAAYGLLEQLEQALPDCKNYGDFSFRVTHLLMDHLGVLILRMGDARLKQAFVPQLKKEILEQSSKALVQQTQDEIKKQLGFDSQAFVRPINVFYSTAKSRNRIEYENGKYQVVDSSISFTEQELLKELDNHPGRFSPNVVMRPLYQEAILPNLAYIGGGGELAYWLERKSQFQYFGIPMPMLIRRQSGMILTGARKKQQEKLGLTYKDLFKEESVLTQLLLANSDQPDYHLGAYKTQVTELYDKLSEHIKNIDPSLAKTSKAEQVKAQKSIEYLESKLKKSIKQKEAVNLNRLTKLKADLFPNGLQERYDNIFQYLEKDGLNVITALLPYCNPFDKNFKIFLRDSD